MSRRSAYVIVKVAWLALFGFVWLWIVPKTKAISDTQTRFWILTIVFAILTCGGELLNTYKTAAVVLWDRALATRLIFRAGIGIYHHAG